MRLNFKQIKGHPVETRSGEQLGRLKDMILETEGQLIVQYVVSPHLWPSKELLISRDQIFSIDNKKIVVDDSVGTTLADKPTKGGQIRISPDPIAMCGD